MRRKLLYSLLGLLAATQTVEAQRIDFNMSGRSVAEGTAPGYNPWAPGRTTQATEKFQIPGTEDYITVTLSAVEGINGNNAFYSHYNKQLVYYQGYKLLGDAADAIYMPSPESSNDYEIPNVEACGLQLTVKGLAAGEHTLLAYHSFVDKQNAAVPKLNVYVNGKLAQRGIQQSVMALTESECATSYVSFSVAGPDEEVVIKYISQPETGVSYSNSGVSINAFVFDEVNPAYAALNPLPANQDYHVAADDGTFTLKWKAAEKGVKHHVMLGTKSGELSEVAVTTDTCHTLNNLYSLNTYYWRIDEETAEGDVYTVDGKLLKSGKAKGASVSGLNLSGIDSGMYMLSVKDTNGKRHSYKILK